MDKELVYRSESTDQPITNSCLVARKFGKRHKHVLESIRGIIKSAENSSVANMFAESTYVDGFGREQPMIVMNRDGFTIVAMGFTGKQAVQFKLDFIAAFNSMEKIVRQIPQQQEQQPKTGAELMLMYAEQMVAQERKLQALESKQLQIEEKVSEIAARTKTDAQYSTIIGFASRYGIRVPVEKASQLGKAAASLCRQYGLQMGEVRDPRFGRVHSYPDSVLFDVYEKYYPYIRFR